jgi:hypothetical protein
MTTSPELTQPAAAAAAPDTPGRRSWFSDRSRILVLVALAMMILGSLLARFVNTDGGATSVSEVTIFGSSGHQISAYVYTPSEASPGRPVPAVAMWHGLNNQKEYMSNTALELARRGFLVVSADQTGHGSSNGANQDAGCGGPDVLTYLLGLRTVDKSRVGLVGMSQGGFCAATAAALAQPDSYKSIFYMESEPNPPGVPDATPYLGLRNVAYNIGTWTELGGMILVDRGSRANVSPQLLQMFGTKEPIRNGEVYGSIPDGTARILYTPWEEHALSTDSPAAIGNAIDWMQQTLTDGAGRDESSQIWPFKLLGTTVALAGAFLFLFAMGSVLLRTRAFATLVRPVPEYRGLTGARWWVGALITTALGPLLYLEVWKHMFIDPWLAPNALWPQTFTNIYMVWAVLVGIIAWGLIALNHVAVTRKQGATLANYGLAEPDRGIDWPLVARALAFVAAVLAPVYLVLNVVQDLWHVDFRAWVVTLMPMTPARWDAFLGYLLPFAVYFLAQAIIFAGFLRWRQGKAPLWQEMLVNSVVLTLGALAWILLCYIPLLTGGTIVFGSDPVTTTAAGLGGIYYLPLLVLWPLSACLFTFYFRKTGRVFVGAFLVTAFLVWSLAASADFALWPING